MKQYADRKENLIINKYEALSDVLKNSLLKSIAYEKALKEKSNKF